KGYLDNTKFAIWFAELQARRGKSNRAIRAELFKKGISRELADQTFEAGGGDETARLRAMIEKKRKLSRYKNDSEKLAKYLTSQGFSWQLVKEALLSDHKNT
ncbi:MAG TPA: RecX family transcriptional regulator, partial [Candidatus Saccharimonadales bacterium]|nr:RecX family transcriptional regulator [Candidatus Saccharimonadales bacterium]